MSSLVRTINLGNSIIGVSILAMPFCFKKCGIVLSILMIIMSGLLNRFSCHLVLKSAIIARRRNYELLAFHTFGWTGKLVVELSVMGFLLGTCIAYFVVIGDIGPSLVSQMVGLTNGPQLRACVMTFLGMFIVLPLGLLRRVESLTSFSMLSLGLYSFLVLKMFSEAVNSISKSDSNDFWSQINYWDSSHLLSNIPIFSMSLSCQTQLFEIFDSSMLLNNDMTSLHKMNRIVNRALYICSAIYISVGIFGYIAFFETPFGGNVLISLPKSFISTLTLTAFIFTVLISFPLCLFPCRTSLHSFLFRKGTGSIVNEMVSSSAPSLHMSDRHFRLLTIALIVTTIGISVLLPHIELVLGILGSTIGAVICFIFPALIFLYLTHKNTTERLMSKLVVLIGIFILIVCTISTLHDIYFVESNDIKRIKSSKSTIVKPIINQNIDPEAINKEEMELKLMITKTVELEPKVKHLPIIDAKKAKRQEELLQRLEKQQQEHKKLLEQQKEILNEMKKHNEQHKESESNKLVIKADIHSNNDNHSQQNNPNNQESKNEIKNFISIDKQNNVKVSENKASIQSVKREIAFPDQSVLNYENKDMNVINIKDKSLNISQHKTDKQIKSSKTMSESVIDQNKKSALEVQKLSLKTNHTFDRMNTNNKTLSNKEFETLVRRNALSNVN